MNHPYKDELVDHISNLIEQTTWYSNCTYADNITIEQAQYLRIFGMDAGANAAIELRPRGSNFQEWKRYYLYIRVCHNGDFSINI